MRRRNGFLAAGLVLTCVLAALILLGLSYMKLASGSFNPFIYFQF